MIYKENAYSGIKYCVWLPDNFDGTNKYPVIFFTHGAGTRGTDLSLVKTHSVLNALSEQAKNAVIVAPLCSENSWFDVFGNLIRLLESIYENPFTDRDHFYGVGVSMGGYAMIQLMESRPGLFAAGIVCCGGGMYWNAERLKNIPLRLFHGAQDTIVYPEESRRMHEKIIDTGGKAELTVYPECEHNCWDRTFRERGNITWLLSQRTRH